VLLDLRVSDYAIVEDLSLEFSEGLNVLTGETGAGKSIIVGALSLLLGERADTDLIRTGRPKAVVEGSFDLSRSPRLRELMKTMGIGLDDGVLYVRRIVSREGRGRCTVNESSVSVSTIKRIGDEMVDMHGQHQHQSLLNTDRHLELLDGFGGLTDSREEVSGLFTDYCGLRDRLSKLEEESTRLDERKELLIFQKKEIEQAKLGPGEDADLEREKSILESFEKLITRTGEVYTLLYEADDAILDKMTSARKSFEEIAGIDPHMVPLVERLRTCHCEIEDISRAVADYLTKKEFDPGRLDQINERLDLISTLKKKYGETIPEIIARADKIAEELSSLEGLDEERIRLHEEIEKLRPKLCSHARDLSRARRRAAASLEEGVVERLRDLAMGKVQFKVLIEQEEESEGLVPEGDRHYSVGPTGMDRVEFFISPNIGEELKPLRKIASGGELSRIMLSIKSILADIDEIPILIFDEIDVGIGGRTAEAVGRRLRSVSEGRQVLCITHLPQIAAYGDVHYQVDKREHGGRTRTVISRLETEERIEEIARMLGGEEITDLTRSAADQLLERARKVEAR
jgi:DNA repair protein RecN (Recombination protein N)